MNFSKCRLLEFSCLAFIVTVLGYLASNRDYSARYKVESNQKNQSATCVVKENDDLGFGESELVKSITDLNSSQILLFAKTSRQLVTFKFHDVLVTGCREDANHPLTDVAASGSGRNFEFCVANLIRLASKRNVRAAEWLVMRFTTDLHGVENPDEQIQLNGTRYNLQKIDGICRFHCSNIKADDRAIIRAQPI